MRLLLKIATGLMAMLCPLAFAAAAPIVVKVAVVTTFEDGSDTGDQPGEFQFWAEREQWKEKINVPGVDHPVYYDGKGMIGVVSGMTSRASVQIMALVLSGKFDFTRTYWLINGIAGADPADVSLGSAAWARYVIDGDIAYEIDAREADAKWPYSIIAIGANEPGEASKEKPDPSPMAWKLNPTLVTWAFNLTRDVAIPDSDDMKQLRALYKEYPNAQRPPFVTLGESLGSSRYWHGKALTQWANDWTKIWTEGQGNFAMTDMEDQGFSEALSRLTTMGKVDFQRVLFLRTASNFCMQAATGNVNESLHAEYAGRTPSLEAAYRVGSKVVHTLLEHWAQYSQATPK
jgi:purine nucleoside permease